MRYELYSFVLDLARETGSLYRDSRTDRTQLLSVIDAGGLTSGKLIFDGDQVFTNGPLPPAKDVRLWLSGYRRPPGEKLTLLLEHYDSLYPATCRTCREILAELLGPPWEGLPALQVADHVLFTCRQLSMELTEFSKEDLHQLILSSANVLPDSGVSLMARFVCRLDPSFEKREYRVTAKDGAKLNTEAYNGLVLIGIAWYVFNERSWEENRLLEKARSDHGQAKLWLALSLSLCCGLRCTDLHRLPPPPNDGPSLAEKARCILDDPDRAAKAAALALDWETRIRMYTHKPNKTHNKCVPPVEFRISDKAKDLVGIILCCVLLEWKEGEMLVTTDARPYRLRGFFGQQFVDLLDGCSFSFRRGNKSYLQGMQAAGSFEEGVMAGYDIAALARSHKGSLISMARTTDIYLRDASFAGYTVDYAILQLFLRGPFSWLCVLLLEAYDRKRYNRLTAQSQTELIKSLCLTPVQLERLTGACSRELKKARSFIPLALAESDDPVRALALCMDRIRESLPDEIQDGSACLRQAVGLSCPSSRRARGCPGCRMELLSRAFVQCLMNEYIDLAVRIRETKEPGTKARLQKIFNERLTPLVRAVPAAFTDFGHGADPAAVNQIILKGAKIAKDSYQNRGE